MNGRWRVYRSELTGRWVVADPAGYPHCRLKTWRQAYNYAHGLATHEASLTGPFTD